MSQKLRHYIFQSTSDIHIQNAHKTLFQSTVDIQKKLRRLALCVYLLEVNIKYYDLRTLLLTPFHFSCQDVFLRNVGIIGNNIAQNQALKENVFMMVVCIELRIPLFLVGKPGSSKSLAKKIVSNAMQGKSSQGKLYKELKAVRYNYVSFIQYCMN